VRLSDEGEGEEEVEKECKAMGVRDGEEEEAKREEEGIKGALAIIGATPAETRGTSPSPPTTPAIFFWLEAAVALIGVTCDAKSAKHINNAAPSDSPDGSTFIFTGAKVSTSPAEPTPSSPTSFAFFFAGGCDSFSTSKDDTPIRSADGSSG
jgi:hypothetical protein